MGCYKSKCKKCGKDIKANDSMFQMQFAEFDHLEKEHPEIYEKNKKAREDFDKAYKKINDKLIYSQEIIFTQTKWDGEDMTDEEATARGYLPSAT